jgi:cell wall assembly regulator SMI1
MTCTELTNQLTDRSLPASVRVEAARRLPLECREYSVWTALCSIVVEEQEDLVVRCGAVQAIPDWSHHAAVNFLTRAFSNEQVRAAAVATLERMGRVEGKLEERLAADLSSIKRGDAHSDMRILNLPGSYGRDPRVIEYLRELLHSPDGQLRARAAIGLCTLGETRWALTLAGDPSPEVRAKLCEVLGIYREHSGATVWEQLLSDPDLEVAKQAKKALRLLGRLEKAIVGERPKVSHPESDCSRLLQEISRLRLSDPTIAVNVPDSMVEAGWLGESGATEDMIEATERRLGVQLPPSYRQFLTESNGFRQLSPFIWKLLGTAEIDWFRVRNAEWIEAYQLPDDISADEHRRAPLDSGLWRAAYLWSCLQISEEGDSAVVLLNPEVVTPDGEWEAWFFANWLPGVERYHSFREYLEHELGAQKGGKQ